MAEQQGYIKSKEEEEEENNSDEEQSEEEDYDETSEEDYSDDDEEGKDDDSEKVITKEMIDEKSLVSEIKRRIDLLNNCDDNTCTECLASLKFFSRKSGGKIPEIRKIIATNLLSLGMLSLFLKIWKKHLKEAIIRKDDEVCFQAIKSSGKDVVNMTDASKDACKKIIKMKIHVDVIKFLKSDFLYSSSQMKNPEEVEHIFQILLEILYNVIQVVNEAREFFRELGMVEILQCIREKEKENYVSCLALMLLAWVIDDEESALVSSDGLVFVYLEEELKSAFNNPLNRSAYGAKAVHLLRAVNKLAVSDDNKKMIIQTGILSCYGDFLKPTRKPKEQVLAAQGIWSLAFTCADEIKEEKSVIEGLQSLLTNAKSDAEVKKQASGALYTINGGSDNLRDTSARDSSKKPPQIFISYNHGSKDIVFKIMNKLKKAGYTIWIDADQMCGSMMQDIIEGIEGATVVIVCLSQKYYESAYCQKELVYSEEEKKEIIPLTVESKFKPQGWLKFTLAARLRIDFTRSESFEDSFKTLSQRLQKIIR